MRTIPAKPDKIRQTPKPKAERKAHGGAPAAQGTPAKGKAVPVRYHRWLKNPRRSGQTRKPPGSAGSIAG